MISRIAADLTAGQGKAARIVNTYTAGNPVCRVAFDSTTCHFHGAAIDINTATIFRCLVTVYRPAVHGQNSTGIDNNTAAIAGYLPAGDHAARRQICICMCAVWNGVIQRQRTVYNEDTPVTGCCGQTTVNDVPCQVKSKILTTGN